MLYKSKKIIAVDDNEIFLDSYESFINSYEGYSIKGIYTNVLDALREYETIYPDIILCDINMPGVDGIEAVSKFKDLDASVKIIFISVHDDVDYVLKSIDCMVDGYLTKPISKSTLFNALQELDKGGAPLSSDISKLIMNLLRKERKKDCFDKDVFSEREIEILKLFTKGNTYKAISQKLFISHSTVNFHIQNIYDKLDVRNKSEALNKLRNNYEI